MKRADRREHQKELRAESAELVRRFKIGSHLVDGLEVPVRLRDLNTFELIVLMRASRQIAALGASAELLLTERHRQARRNWQREQELIRWKPIRLASQILIAEGVSREVRIESIAAMIKAARA